MYINYNTYIYIYHTDGEMGMIIANPILDPGVRVVGSQQPNLGKK